MSTEYSTQAVIQLSPHTATLISNLTSNNSTSFVTAAMSAVATWASDFRALVGSSLSTVNSTADVVVPLDQDSAVAFVVSWACTDSTQAINLNVSVGDRWRSKLADFDLLVSPASSGSTGTAVARRWLIGPFESARFGKQATSTNFGVKMGQHYVRFALTTEYSNMTAARAGSKVSVLPFRMPRVDYDT